MNYEINEQIEFGGSKFEVVGDIGLEDSKKRKSSFFAGALSLILFVLVAAAGYFAIRLIHPPMCFPLNIWTFVILIGSYALYLFVHELIRGLVYMLLGGVSLKDLLFGVSLKQGSVYCISKAPVRIRRVRVSLLIPFITIFIPLAVLGVYYANIVLVMGAALAITLSATDFVFMHRIRKHSGGLYLLQNISNGEGDDLGGYILKELVAVYSIEKE